MTRLLVPMALAAVLAGCVNIQTTVTPAPNGAANSRVPAGEVLFSLHPEQPAQSVSLTGDFANWDPSAIAMSDEDGDGTWTTTHVLTPGEYQYKFVINGTEWLEDPANPERIGDSYGGHNSVLHVGGEATTTP